MMSSPQFAEWSPFDDEILPPHSGFDLKRILELPVMKKVIADAMYTQIMELGSLDISKPVIDEIIRVLSNFPTIIDQIVIPFIGSNPNSRRAVWNGFRRIFNLDSHVYLLTQGLPEPTQLQRQLEAELLDYASKHPMTPAKLQVWTLLLTGEQKYEPYVGAWFELVKTAGDQSAPIK